MAKLTKTASTSYEAPLDDVRAMLFDRAFREKVCIAQGLLSYEIDMRSEDDQTIVAIDKTQAAAGLPSAVTKIVGDTVHLLQKETWTGDSAIVELSIPGKPGEGRGRVSLTSDGTTTTQSVEIEITVNIPVVGSKIAGVIGDQFIEAMKKSFSVGGAWMAGDR